MFILVFSVLIFHLVCHIGGSTNRILSNKIDKSHDNHSFLIMSTLSGPSNQLFGLVNALAITLEFTHVKALWLPIEPHYLFLQKCLLHNNTLKFCNSEKHSLKGEMYLNINNPTVQRKKGRRV